MEILYSLIKGKKVSQIMETFDNMAVVEMQKFVWEKTVEFGLKCRGRFFDRKEITRKMTPTAIYKKKRGCEESIYNCKGTQCINNYSECARNKIREHIDVMAEVVQDYIKKA